MKISDVTMKLDPFDEVIWNHEKEFLERFTVNGCGQELIETCWGPNHLQFVFLVDSGATPVDSVSINVLQNWFDELIIK